MKIDKNYYDSLVRDSEKLRIIESMIEAECATNKTMGAVLGLNTKQNYWNSDFPDYDLPCTIPGENKHE